MLTMDVFPVLPEKLSFDIPDRSTVSFSTTGGGEPPRVGYGQIRPDGGRSTPSGMALFELRNRDGVLITEEAVPASEPVHPGTDLCRGRRTGQDRRRLRQSQWPGGRHRLLRHRCRREPNRQGELQAGGLSAHGGVSERGAIQR